MMPIPEKCPEQKLHVGTWACRDSNQPFKLSVRYSAVIIYSYLLDTVAKCCACVVHLSITIVFTEFDLSLSFYCTGALGYPF